LNSDIFQVNGTALIQGKLITVWTGYLSRNFYIASVCKLAMFYSYNDGLFILQISIIYRP